MKKETDDTVHFYSNDLLQKLEAITNAAVTLVAAPAGYGKTTAVRDFLKRREEKSPGLKAEWITASNDAWEKLNLKILNFFEKIDSTINVDAEIYLILDNVELLPDQCRNMILEGTRQREKMQIHLLFLSNREDAVLDPFFSGSHQIIRKDFIFSATDILQYFKMAESEIRMEDAIRLYDYTNGWIAAIYLQLLSLKRTGDILHSGAAILLMKSVVWDALTQEEKELLLSVAPFRTVTEKQLAYVLNRKDVPEEMKAILDKIPFIWKKETPLRYEIHAILQELLTERLTDYHDGKRAEIELRAGDCFKEQGQLETALCLYWKNRDYERILATDIGNISCVRNGDARFGKMAEDILQNCSDSLLSRFPKQGLRMVIHLCGRDTREIQKEFLERLLTVFNQMNVKEEERRHLLGEWTLIHALTRFPDMEHMLSEIKEAGELLEGKSSVIEREDPFLFEIPMLLLLAHSTPGNMDRSVATFEEAINLYSVITNGNGSGAGTLLRAEAALCKGFFEEASLYCYKAAYLAGSNQQAGVLRATELTLSLIALCTGGEEGLKAATKLLNHFANEEINFRDSESLTNELISSAIYYMMGIETGDQPAGMEASQTCVPWTVILMEPLKEVYTFFREKNYVEVIQYGEKLSEKFAQSDSVYALILIETILSLSYAKLEQAESARDRFMKAFSRAMPDGFILPFYVLWEQIVGMICMWDKQTAEEFLNRETVMRIDRISKEFREKWRSYCIDYIRIKKTMESEIKK